MTEFWSHLRTYKTTGRLSRLHSCLNSLHVKGTHCLAVLAMGGLIPVDRGGPLAIHRPWAVKCVLRTSKTSEAAPSQAMVAFHAVNCAMGPAPASAPVVKLHLALGISWTESEFAKWGFHFVLALNVLLLQLGMDPHLFAEVILGLHWAPNPICGQRDRCFWKVVLAAKYPVKMQSSSQTKDLIKDHFSFMAFFTTTAV